MSSTAEDMAMHALLLHLWQFLMIAIVDPLSAHLPVVTAWCGMLAAVVVPPQIRPRHFLTRKQQADRWNKSVKTIERWGADPKMDLPPEYMIGNTPSRDEVEIEVWERSRIGKLPDSRAPAEISERAEGAKSSNHHEGSPPSAA
jgi:hypothetical protein